MAASTGALAAERERLEREIEALSSGLPAEAAEVVRRADVIMAEHGERIAELKAKRDAIDRTFDVTERDRRAAAQQQREAQWLAQRKALLDEEDVRLQAVADAEAAARALADGLTRTIEANARLSRLARALSPDGRAPQALSAADLVMRLAARVAAVMSTVRDDKGRRGWLGPIEWNGVHSVHPVEQCWADDEQRRIAVGLQSLIEQGKA